MRVLLVGAGTVGEAIAKVAADRRPWLEQMVVADYDLGPRAASSVDSIQPRRRYIARSIDASSPAAVAEAAQAPRRRPGDERGRPAVRDADLRRRARRERQLHGHGDEPVAANAGNPFEKPGIKLGDEQFARRPTGAGRAGWRWSAWAWTPACRTSSPPTPRSNLFDATALTRSTSATAATWRSPVSPSRRCSASGRRSRSASTRRSSGSDGGVAHHGAVQRGRDVPLSRGHRRRSSASTWSTKRSCSCRAGCRRQARHLQVRAGRRTSSTSCKTIHALGMDRTDKVRVKGVEVAPRDVLAAITPDPAKLGDQMVGRAIVGTWVIGRKDGQPARGLPVPDD